MTSVDISQLRQIPYIVPEMLEGRFLSTLSFYIEGEWHLWIPTSEGLTKVKAFPAEGFYFAVDEERPEDIHLHFLDLFAQRASFANVQKPMQGLMDDLLNLSASLAKLDLLFESKERVGTGISRMAATEIEYIFSVCRSIFDLLQEMISKLWDTVSLFDTSVKKKRLKESFADMVLFEGAADSTEGILSRFGLPREFADFYARNAEFFLTLRKFRDNIAHRGSSTGLILATGSSFAVADSLAPFAGFNVWRDEDRQSNGFCSLAPAIGYLVHQTIAVCDDFSRTIEKVVMFEAPVAPGLKLFMRGFFNGNLISNFELLERILNGKR
jgi:hypothetical protein